MVAGTWIPLDIDLPVSTLSTRTEANTPVVNVSVTGTSGINPAKWISLLDGRALPGPDHGKLRIQADANVDALVISNIMNAAAQAGTFRFAGYTKPG